MEVDEAGGGEGDGATAGNGVRDGLVKQEFDRLLGEGNARECVKLLQRSESDLEVDMPEAAKLLNDVSKTVLLNPKEDEKVIVGAYDALKSAGLLKAFGSIDLDVVPTKSRQISADKLMELTGMEVNNLAPGKPMGAWLAAGAGLFATEVLLGKVLGVDALSTIVPITLGVWLADKALVGGALAESAIRIVVPGYREKIVRHEAGHFLLAYLLGCPVQGCLLDPFEIGKYATSGAQGGTVFADPSFARGMDTGKLTRSAIDRFSIVLMGGIAAEAIEYGTSEGGSSDERVLIEILSTIAPPFNMDQIKSQALWAAAQAVLLIKEHREAYEVLVSALDKGADLGECVTVLEEELARKPLPGDLRREDLKPLTPAEEVKDMVIRRMSQRYWQHQEEKRIAAAAQMNNDRESTFRENKDNAMLDLQRRVEELERTIKAGRSLEEATGTKSADAGGVWMNDLEALREDIMASKSEMAVVTAEPTAQAVVENDSSSSLISGINVGDDMNEDGGTMNGSAELRDIETKKAENARRMADVEARIQKFKDEHA